MKHSRPCKHLRVIRTKRGLKRIIINPDIVKNKKKNYGEFPKLYYSLRSQPTSESSHLENAIRLDDETYRKTYHNDSSFMRDYKNLKDKYKPIINPSASGGGVIVDYKMLKKEYGFFPNSKKQRNQK